MAILTVAVPGPWWTLLSYQYETSLPDGIRVNVPLGRSYRVGLTASSNAAQDENVSLKEISAVLDEKPALPDELWRSIGWFGKSWFVGTGMALKTLTPTKFLEGEPLDPLIDDSVSHPEQQVRYVYDPLDGARWDTYTAMLSTDPDGNLILFPEVSAAKRFWHRLPKELKEQGLLWPVSNPAKQWTLWQSIRRGEVRFVVGSPAAASLPMPGIRRIVVEDEASVAWKMQKHPDFHRRSFLAVRARNAGAEFVLGGRMPSSKVYKQDENDPHAKEGLDKRSVFVNMWDAKGLDEGGIKERIPISAPLVRETKEALRRGQWALWILDRKGYAGEIYCEECGSPVYCPKCGAVIRWEGRKKRLHCSVCGTSERIPETCPSCKSHFLEGHRPGIEAIYEKAARLLQSAGSAVIYEDKMNVGDVKKERARGGLVVGTRRVIALADELEVGLVGWIDADGEARSPEYDARTRAFGLIWESAWRGEGASQRRIVLQSRWPGKGWQQGIVQGWGAFWRDELKERKLLELPPFMPILRVEMPKGKGADLIEALLDQGLSCWQADENEDLVWVRTRKFEALRNVLEPFFHIKNTRVGMPAVTLYPD